MLSELDADAWLFVSLAWLLAGINIPKSDIRLENVLNVL